LCEIVRILTIYIVINSRITANARDNILPVCIVLDGTMLLFLVMACFQEVSHAPIRRSGVPALPNFWGSFYLCVHRLSQNYQI